MAREKVTYLNHADAIPGDPVLSEVRRGEGKAADMHMHTVYSDGSYNPSRVVELAKKKNLSTIAITDHDTVAGVNEALRAGERLGIEVVPGIELSAHWQSREVHILGLFVDIHNKHLLDHLSIFRLERVKRAREIVHKLNELDIPVSIDSVLDSVDGSVGRPHIAQAVLDTGHVRSYLEVFQKYIGYGKPAFVEKSRFEAVDAIRLIAHAGGLAFIAHPTETVHQTILFELFKEGLDGIETVHPSLTKQKTLTYRAIAKEHSLLETGGSDFHGGKKNDESNVGEYYIPAEFLDAMRKRLVA